jgi:beta-glucanase (GH16 family)
MPKTSLPSRASLFVLLFAALLLSVGSSTALAGTSFRSNTSKRHATAARKHNKHAVKKIGAKKTVATAAAANATLLKKKQSGLSGCTTSAPADPQPNGPSGSWSPVFDDEFNGTSVNTTAWSTDNGYTNQNNVNDSSNNIVEAGGCVALTLASSTSGAEMTSNSAGLLVGDFAEARIQFAGSGTSVDNWPAFWTAGAGWPESGEQDIFEGAGRATVNYHYAVNGQNTQAGPFDIPGDWAGSFHTYGIYRGTNYCDVYWDGQLVKSYPTDDNGVLEYLLLTEGADHTLAFGASGQMLVDYVRIWQHS